MCPLIISYSDPQMNEPTELVELAQLAALHLHMGPIVILTGAGISVESGIPDFRSKDGLWSVFDPDLYASIDTFYRSPSLCWEMFRALAQNLRDKHPNAAHLALAELQNAGLSTTIITQNVDGLHQIAGSLRVLEIHGDHRSVQCLKCGYTGPFTAEYLLPVPSAPACPKCNYPLKPNMVLFGEDVRCMEEIHQAVDACGLMLVIGTSANVYPASDLPARAHEQGALIVEFNLESTPLTRGEGYYPCQPYALLQGSAEYTVPIFCKHLLHYAAEPC